jgi:phosphoglucomutase
MAEKMGELEAANTHTVVFSYEESYGYMIGHHVRDKDAVTASVLLCEMAAWYAAQGMTLFEALSALYEKYGFYAERTQSLVMPGLDGLENMKRLMNRLREEPFSEIAGVPVEIVKDYLDGTVSDKKTGKRGEMELRGSNVLRFELSDGTSFLIRPSGTEPKIKVYVLARGESLEQCRERAERYAAFAQTLQG